MSFVSTRNLTSLPAALPVQLPVAWAEASAAIIETLDDPELPCSVAKSLSTLLTFDECRQILYAGESRPTVVFDSLQEHTHRSGIANYVSNSYIINPTYRMYRSGKLTGPYRMRDIACFNENDVDLEKYRIIVLPTEEIGFVTEGMPAGNEELCVGLAMPDGTCAMISLSRKRSSKGYMPEEVGRIGSVVPFLTAAFRRYWQKTRVASSPEPKGFKLLSPREREIVDLLMKGHSTLSISLRLNISTTTVKTHRKNLYAKLSISTQYELFSLCTNALHHRPAFQA
ncbi:LuxR C-terminal-related transcriptional regulator [Mesorhizobium sp. CO1-1-8]|uniref:LuxR C-terminal-related transcriptional regulator n=1 Tax=Mesorhizobium sp. CO1-1-8 TaxID=2876631 RepID=UPI001CD0B4AE|nr:LuxR C-terminal-related transcriptional regulator [Mesorhizobium sp. CO1-1-8]MBZ9772237.1 LuxR C-terminal-related transcriptional regulator [Mesorhizobium sp. CO1-1-8]